MGLFLKIFDKLAEDEDEEFTTAFYDTFWIFPQASMTFPSWKRSYIPLSIFLLIVHSVTNIVHLVILVISILLELTEGKWEMLTLSINYALLLSYSMFVTVFFNYLRKNMVAQQKWLAKDIGVYSSGRIYDEQWCVEKRKQCRLEMFYLMTIPCIIGVTACCVLFVPYFAKWYSGMDQPYTPSGINTNLPISGWYPFPTHEGVLHFVAVGGQLMCCLSIAIVISTLMYMMLYVAQQLKFELSVVGYSLKCLFDRSLKLYNLKYPKNRSMVDKTVFQRVIGLCLRDSVIHHQNLTQMIALFKVEVGMPAAVGYTNGILVIGMSLYVLLLGLDAQNYETIVTSCLLIFIETLVMFMMSLVGASLSIESESLRNELYFMGWYNLDVHNRKLFLNFQIAITQPVIIKAAGIMNMSMDTFSSMMNSAYSFFNIMNVQSLS